MPDFSQFMTGKESFGSPESGLAASAAAGGFGDMYTPEFYHDSASPKKKIMIVDETGIDIPSLIFGNGGSFDVYSDLSSLVVSPKTSSNLVSSISDFSLHSPEFFGVDLKVNTSGGFCPNINDTSQCPDSCVGGFVCDGFKCIPSHECPCPRGGYLRQPGSVWKENNGCTNCLCLGGNIQCVEEICDIVRCPLGQILISASDGDSCCPLCIPKESICANKVGSKFKIGEKWRDTDDNCKVCSCTESGVQCDFLTCSEVIPTCSPYEVLTEDIVDCCPTYSCQCDPGKCKDSAPLCPPYHESVVVSVDSCCPSYECVCRTHLCEIVSCMPGEKRIRQGNDIECCPVYSCERIGCVDNGIQRSIGDQWTPSDSSCEIAECVADEHIIRRPISCPSQTPDIVCSGGKLPSSVRSADGCCISYVCDCTCRGYGKTAIEMFGGQTFTKSCPCTHTLVKDTSGRDFHVSLRHRYCKEKDPSSGTCFGGLILDNLASGVKTVIKHDLKVHIGHNIFDMTTRNSVDDLGYSVIKRGSAAIVVRMVRSGLEVSYDSQSAGWIINAPTMVGGQVEGLCGTCDGVTNKNEYFISDQKVEFQQFLDHYLVLSTDDDSDSPICRNYVEPSQLLENCSYTSKCDEVLLNGPFESCSAVSPPYQYVQTCAKTSCSGNIELTTERKSDSPMCSVIAAYAQKCATHGECIDWRSSDFCPYNCPAGLVYKSCGPSIERTCQNKDTYSTMNIKENVEGCFCPDDLIFSNGLCISVQDCPVCMDETRTSRMAGEQWQLATNPCIYVTCQEDGSLLQSSTSCPSTPSCQYHETLHKVVDGVCCPIYVCESINREEECTDVSCMSSGVPTCNNGEEIVAVHTGISGCCFEYDCVCKTHLCPQVTEPVCGEGERLASRDPNSCCPVKICECVETSCPPSKDSCPSGYIRSLANSSRCCQTYECICDYAWCLDSKPLCESGQSLITIPPDTYSCCSTYECNCDVTLCPTKITSCASGYRLVKSSSDSDCCESYECECDITACPVRSATSPCLHEEGYKMVSTGRELRELGLPSCCPTQVEKICICDTSSCAKTETKCESFERKYQINLGTCCPRYACECDSSLCARNDVTTCEGNKKLVSVRENRCCSRISCECQACEEPQSCEEGLEYDDVHDDCGCLIRTCIQPLACIYEGERYEPGSIWMDDICTECICSDDATGFYKEKCTAIKCGTCSSGYVYVPIAGQCCGDCVPNMCHYGGYQYTVGQTWSSGDCRKCSCKADPLTNEVYSECLTTACPSLDLNCVEEDMRTTEDGCCTYCAASSQTCEPQIDTFDYITIDGCVSSERINVTKCAGSCTSSSKYSFILDKYTTQCTCCRTQSTRVMPVEIVCPDESTQNHIIHVAESCSCHATSCSPEE